MSDGFIMPLGSYGDVIVIIDSGGVQPFGLKEQFGRLENAFPDLSELILKMADAFHTSVVTPMKTRPGSPSEFAIEFSINFSVEGGVPVLQIGAQSGLNVMLSWK